MSSKITRKEKSKRMRQSKADKAIFRRATNVPKKGKKSNPRIRKTVRSRRSGKSKFSDLPGAYGSVIETNHNANTHTDSTQIPFTNMITSVTANTFEIKSFDVSAVNSALFPWESQIAGNFEEYRIRDLTIWYMPRVGTDSSGFMSMAFSYNAQDTTPTNEFELFTYAKTVRGSIFQKLKIDMKDSKWLFCQPPALPAEYDLKTFQAGRLFLACVSSDINTVVGSIFFDAKFDFRKPKENKRITATQSMGVEDTADNHAARNFFAGTDHFGNDSLIKVNDSEYRFVTPGKYVIPAQKIITEAAATSTTVPSSATYKSQLKDLAVGFLRSNGNFLADSTYGSVGLASEPQVQALTATTPASSVAAMNWDWIFTALKPNAVLNTAMKPGGGTPEIFNSSTGGWGSLWDTFSASATVAMKAAPYLLPLVSLFLLQYDELYEERLKAGIYDELIAYEVPTNMMPNYYIMPEDGEIFNGLSSTDCQKIVELNKFEKGISHSLTKTGEVVSTIWKTLDGKDFVRRNKVLPTRMRRMRQGNAVVEEEESSSSNCSFSSSKIDATVCKNCGSSYSYH